MSRRRFVLPATQERDRVDRILVGLLEHETRTTVQRWIAEGRVLLDGRPCRPRDPAGPGSCLDVEPGAVPPSAAEPDATVEFGVVFEDQHLIVVDKPAGLVVHPARGHRTGTLVNGLLARTGFENVPADPRDPQGRIRPGVVHRLDSGTSGLLVVAKDGPSREGLKTQISARSVERVYRAIVVGVPMGTTIRSLHGRHPQSRLRFTSRVASGKLAVTTVQVVEALAGGSAALVECRLQTGRTHQIRVHLTEQARTPILGDPLYGGPPSSELLRRVAWDLGRQALHAAVLGFAHPVTGDWLRFESPLPLDMARALAELRDGSAT